MIEATEYICTPPGEPMFVTTPGGGPCVVRVRIQSDDTVDGMRFIEWLRDKLKADQNAAKAFKLLPPTDWDDPVRTTSTGDPMPPNPTSICRTGQTIGGVPVLDEGGPADELGRVIP